MDLSDRYKKVMQDIRELAKSAGRNPDDIRVVAVTKTRTKEEALEIYSAGCRDFGENKVQEALPKAASYPKDLRWHYIGHLQTKKVPKIIGRFHLIHSVDSPKLARKISEVGLKNGITTPILLEVNVSGEGSKQGLSPENWLAELDELFSLPHIEIQGLMTMAPLTEEEKVIRHCFSGLRDFRERLEKSFSRFLPHLSMGMTNDYKIAIEEGATYLRLGTAFFG